MYRRCSVHSSFCSESRAPTRRMTAARSGKMPTESVPRSTPQARRFLGTVGPHLAPDGLGEGGEGRHVVAGLIKVLGRSGGLGLQRLGDVAVLGERRATSCSEKAVRRCSRHDHTVSLIFRTAVVHVHGSVAGYGSTRSWRGG